MRGRVMSQSHLKDDHIVIRVTKTHINLANLLISRMALGKKDEHIDAIRLFRGSFAFRFAAMQAKSGGKFNIVEVKDFYRKCLKNRQMFINFIKLYVARMK